MELTGKLMQYICRLEMRSLSFYCNGGSYFRLESQEASGLTERIPVRSNPATNDWIPKSLRLETFKWVKYEIPRR